MSVATAYRRVVTTTEVGDLGVFTTRRRARKTADRFNAMPAFTRPVEYGVVRRSFLRWRVVAYQARLVSIKENGHPR